MSRESEAFGPWRSTRAVGECERERSPVGEVITAATSSRFSEVFDVVE